jgi:hypothetical protein
MEGALMVLNELIEMYENYAYYVEKNIKLPKASRRLHWSANLVHDC